MSDAPSAEETKTGKRLDSDCNKEHGTTTEEKKYFGYLLSAAAIASAAVNAAKAVELATKEYDMAIKYWNISRKWLNYYKDYFAPVEDQELEEARNIPIEQPLYEVARGRARVAAMMQFRDMAQKSMRCMSVYCTGLRQDMLMEISDAQADAISLADGLGYRNERAYVENRNDVRFEKMFNTAKRGRDMVADNVSAAKSAANIYGDLYDQAWNGLTGAGQYLGYWSNRNETAYPTSYLGSAARRTGQRGGVVDIENIIGWSLGEAQQRSGPTTTRSSGIPSSSDEVALPPERI